MPDGDRVGSAYVDIHVNAAPGEAELAAFKAKVDRDFAELDRKKAEAKVKLDAVEFDRTIDKVKTELDNLKRKKASVTIEADTKQLDADIAEAEAELKALTAKKRTIQIDSRQVKAAHDAERLLAKEQALTERQAIQSAKAERALSSEREKAVTRTVKERAELAKLSQEYEKLRGRQIGLEKSSRRVFSPRSVGVAENEARKLERVASEADYVKHKIEALGGSVEHLDPQLSRNSSFIDKWLSRLGDTSIRIGPLTTSVKGLAAGLGLLGPLVFELGGGLTALAGTVGEGAAGAFTVAAGAAAGFALSAAGVGFVIGPMIGEFKEVHAATTALAKAQLKYGKDSTQAKTAQEQLNHELKGVSPIAKEGIQAWGGLKDRWKELTKAARPAVFNAFGQSLKTVQDLLPAFASESTKTTQVAAKAWDGWMKSLRSSEAKGILKSIMSDFRASIPGLADGLGSLVAMMGRLSAAGAHFLPGLSNGFAEWANNLEQSVGGGQKLTSEVGSMVSQMRDLGHLTQDTGSLLVHIFDAGASSGQGMVKSLDQVIKRWDKWTQSASGKNGLQEFFGDSKTATEAFMSSLSHMTKLLFEFSRATAPVANGLLQIVTWIGDLVSAADKVVGIKQAFQALGLVLGGLFIASKVSAYGDAIAGVAVRLGLMEGAAAGDVAATEALTAATTELTAALTATAAAGTAVDAALGAEGVLGAAAAADAGLGAGAAGATRAALGLDATTESAGLLSAALAPEVLIPAAAIAGMAVLAASTGHVGTAFQKAASEFSGSNNKIERSLNHIEGTTHSYINNQHAAADATDAVKEAQRRVHKLYAEDAPMKKQTAAQIALTDAEKRAVQAATVVAQGNAKQTTNAKQLLKVSEERVKSAETEIKNAKELAGVHKGMGMGGPVANRRDAERAEQMAKAERDLAKARGEVTHASNELALATVPLSRETQGLDAISQKTMTGLKELSKTIGAGAAAKIGNFVKPSDVAKVTELSNKLKTLGRGSQVKQIDVKSHGADETLGKLRQLQKQTKNVEGHTARLTVKSNDTQANASLRKLSALSQRVTGSKNTIHILANSSSAENAVRNIRQHLEQVAHQKYQATMSAVDKTQPGWQAAYHHLREKASAKYQAEITAVDHASSVAKHAGSAADATGRKKPNINITATASQALSEVKRTEAAINAISSNVHPAPVIVPVTFRATNSPPTGKFAGGPAGYMAPFAVGGPSQAALERAAEKAVILPGGTSRKVSKPTMLTGEEGPGHPEYVIATNPAYRSSNEQYLEDAAGDLGKEVVPAYKEGKGKKKKKGKGGGATGAADPGAPPFKHESKRHINIKKAKFAPAAINKLNADEQSAQQEERQFNAELSREEQEIAHKKRSAWDFNLLKGFLNRQLGFEDDAKTQVHTARADSTKAINKWTKVLKGDLSKSNVRAAEKSATSIMRDYNAMKEPKEKDYSTKSEYRKAKSDFSHRQGRKHHEAEQAKDYATRLRKERERAQKVLEEAQEELRELNQEVAGERGTKHFETMTELQNLEDIEANPSLAPYYEEAAAGKEGSEAERPSTAEQLGEINKARYNLYREFGSNVAPVSNGAGGGDNPLVSGANGLTDNAFLTRSAAGAAPGAGGVISGSAAQHSTVNNVTNNFAAPPPDPHTWTMNQKFELSAAVL